MSEIEKEERKESTLKKIIKVILWIVGVIGVLFIAMITFKPYAFHGAILQSPNPAQDFTLLNHYGQETSLSDYRGKVVLLYFGYAACPDVCPATLAEIKQANDILKEEGRNDEMQFLMIMIDPERDTAERTATFLAHFDPSFMGLLGEEEKVAQIATQYGIFYEKQESESAMGYLVDHTATTILIDPDGYMRLMFAYGTEGADMAADIIQVLDH
ncbi:MAG: SCO family protein [Anaerolineae bacterium]|jgi:protein SCO1/2|nr:SCO family protein [Anaerolineae bacterium]MBT7190377.1 SCO family protein [Anaerolineae bacterium]MBT7989185.1 SCO family protein [Anaerolineae bacterium]